MFLDFSFFFGGDDFQTKPEKSRMHPARKSDFHHISSTRKVILWIPNGHGHSRWDIFNSIGQVSVILMQLGLSVIPRPSN